MIIFSKLPSATWLRHHLQHSFLNFLLLGLPNLPYFFQLFWELWISIKLTLKYSSTCSISCSCSFLTWIQGLHFFLAYPMLIRLINWRVVSKPFIYLMCFLVLLCPFSLFLVQFDYILKITFKLILIEH